MKTSTSSRSCWAQQEAGLQAKTRTGEWLSIQPPEGALVVNVGDMLQRLTNNVLPSTTHRVINPSAERMRFSRYSTPFFLHFNPDFLIETLRPMRQREQSRPVSRADHGR